MNRFKSYTLLILFALSIFSVSNAQEQSYIEAQSLLDTNQIVIGDQIHYTIKLKQPASAFIQVPLFQDTLVKNLEILSSPEIDTTTIANNMIEVNYKYLVTSFDSGYYYLPGVPISFMNGAEKQEGKTNPQLLYVATMQIDTAQAIFDIKQPYQAPLTFVEVAVPTGIVLLALLVIGFIVYVIRRRMQNKPIFKAPKPKIPAHIQAKKALHELKDKALWQNNEYKAYYSELTDIVRTYMEGRFGLSAMEQTTDETLQDLSSINEIEKETAQKIEALLREADLVKFAKAIPAPDDNETHWNTSYQFVEKTEPKEVIEEDKENTISETTVTEKEA